MEKMSKSIKDTKDFASEFIKSFKKNPEGATVVGLYGNLGSGKTTFFQCVAEILGVEGAVTSPTFVIQKTYSLKPNTHNFKKLVHIDAYRLKNGGELEKLGFEEILKDPENLVFIEWPEHIEGVLPEDALKLKFEFVDDTTRRIEL